MTSFFREASESRRVGVTYHLVPVPVWGAQKESPKYIPEMYETDGFIHCTNGLDQLLTVANTFYKDDTRDFLVLAIDLGSLESPVRYDDPDDLFPHIYGPLNTDAVRDQQRVRRGAGGTFVRFDK